MRLLIATTALLILAATTQTHAAFDDHFTDKTLRIDYHHTGDATTEVVSIDRVYVYGTWAGSLVNLVDT